MNTNFYEFHSSPKFRTFTPNIYELQLIGEQRTIIVIYYIGDKPLTLEEFKTEKVKAYIEVLWNFPEETLVVMSLHVDEKYRGQGLGSFLMILASTEAQRVGLKSINLDDDTDLYRHQRNMYLQLGLKYVSKDGPEMIGKIRTVASKWRLFKDKYL